MGLLLRGRGGDGEENGGKQRGRERKERPLSQIPESAPSEYCTTVLCNFSAVHLLLVAGLLMCDLLHDVPTYVGVYNDLLSHYSTSVVYVVFAAGRLRLVKSAWLS